MRWALIYCALLGVFLISNAVIFKFSNFVCESYNKSWFQFHECRLKAVSRDKVILNMNGTIMHPAYYIDVEAKVLKRANGFKPWLLEARVDGCRFIRKSYNPVVKLIFGLFKDFSNFNHSCPYMGPQYVMGFYLRPELLLLPFPSGEYMLTLRWFFDQKLQFDTNFESVECLTVLKKFRLKAVSRERVVMNMNGSVLHPVNDVFVHGNLYKRESGFKPWLIKATVDCCRFMKTVAKLIFGLFKEFTNMNHTCPYLGQLIFRGFYLKPELLRLPFPSGDYKLTLRWLFDHKLQHDTNVSFMFVEDLIKA